MNHEPQIGDLCVWWNPQVGRISNCFTVPVSTVEEAKKLLNVLAAYDLFQLKSRIKPDFCNTGGLEVYEEDEDGPTWCEWVDEQGRTINEVLCNQATAQE